VLKAIFEKLRFAYAESQLRDKDIEDIESRDFIVNNMSDITTLVLAEWECQARMRYLSVEPLSELRRYC